MKVAVVSDSERRGGAAIAADRLSRALANTGVDILRVVAMRDSLDSAVIDSGGLRPHEEVFRSVLMRLGAKGAAKAWQARTREDRIAAAVGKFSPHVVQLHNLHGAGLTLRLLDLLGKRDAPLVWTLHDMWAFTGGCAYAYDCEAFRHASCDETCPNPDEYPPLDRSQLRNQIAARQRFFDRNAHNVVIVTPSRWLAGKVRMSVAAPSRVEVIANGVDTECFSPMPMEVCRKALSLPLDVPIVLTGGVSLRDARKGLRYLTKALDELRTTHKFHLITFGQCVTANGAYSATHFGTVHDERLLRLVYGAADVFAFPSLADNLPSVLLEASACGLASVAFDVGGVPEVVREGQTGFLAAPRDHSDLAQKLRSLLSLGSEQRSRMEQRCREVALQEFDLVKQARCYQELFASLVRDKNPVSPYTTTADAATAPPKR